MVNAHPYIMQTRQIRVVSQSVDILLASAVYGA